MAAISGIDPPDNPDVYSEEHWSVPEQQTSAYPRSKTLAERAAWEFIKNLPEGESIELTTVCPSLIIGPTEVAQGFASG